MDYLEFLFLGAIGVVGGMLSGLVGVGGGIVFVPGLLYVGGWRIQDAVAASLVIIIFSSLSGTIRNARSADPVNWRVAGLLSLAVAPSSLIGVLISRVSPEIVVKIAFATLLIALAYPTARGGGDYDSDRKDIPLPLVFLAGIFIGTLSGLVGVGGGVVMVPLDGAWHGAHDQAGRLYEPRRRDVHGHRRGGRLRGDRASGTCRICSACRPSSSVP